MPHLSVLRDRANRTCDWGFLSNSKVTLSLSLSTHLYLFGLLCPPRRGARGGSGVRTNPLFQLMVTEFLKFLQYYCLHLLKKNSTQKTRKLGIYHNNTISFVLYVRSNLFSYNPVARRISYNVGYISSSTSKSSISCSSSSSIIGITHPTLFKYYFIIFGARLSAVHGYSQITNVIRYIVVC